MTENKRFTKCCPKIRDYDEEMSCTEVCDLLNKFYEENKELKADNKRMVKFIMSKGYTLKDYLDWLKDVVWK